MAYKGTSYMLIRFAQTNGVHGTWYQFVEVFIPQWEIPDDKALDLLKEYAVVSNTENMEFPVKEARMQQIRDLLEGELNHTIEIIS